MEYVKDWELTKKRFHAFWEGEITDRCMVAIFAPRRNSKFQVFPFPNDRNEQIKYWTDGEFVLKRNLDYFENTYFCGDAFPQIMVNLGAAGLAGYFMGSQFIFQKDTVWFPSVIHDTSSFPLEFNPGSFLYQKTLYISEYFARESNGRYFVSLPDVSGNLDALAHLRGNENTLMDLITEPEWVHQSLARIQEVWQDTVEKVYKIVSPANEGGSTIGWLNTWSPGRHSQMQCDISVMLSPAMFKEYTVPELKAQSKWMNRSLYHFDGVEQIRHLDLLLSLEELDAIQWTYCAGQKSPVEYLPYLKKIQAAGKKLVIPFFDSYNERDLETLLCELSQKGLLLIARVPSEDEANHLLSMVERTGLPRATTR